MLSTDARLGSLVGASDINGMDCYARGLRAAAKLIEDGKLDSMVKDRYAGFDQGIGLRFARGEATLEELAAHAASAPEPALRSGKHEALESIFNRRAYGG